MAVCSVCGGKAGLLASFNLKDGKCCMKCWGRFLDAGIDLSSSGDIEDFTAQEVNCFLEEPEKWNAIAKERKEQRETRSVNCLICGKPLTFKNGKFVMLDGYALCTDCNFASITISPQEYLQGDEKYIRVHSSHFFKENMEHIEHPHPALYVNFTLQRFFYAGEWVNTEDCVFSFDDVIKFESDVQTYEVTVGKKGHPIARAVVGGSLFGGAGAVVGAMTTKNTKHKETREGKRYICIYHKDPVKPEMIRKRTCFCNTDEDIVKLEDCLKRAFECRDVEQREQEKTGGEASTTESANNYSELIELKKLLDMGIVTQEEFDIKKKQILGL